LGAAATGFAATGSGFFTAAFTGAAARFAGAVLAGAGFTAAALAGAGLAETFFGTSAATPSRAFFVGATLCVAATARLAGLADFTDAADLTAFPAAGFTLGFVITNLLVPFNRAPGARTWASVSQRRTRPARESPVLNVPSRGRSGCLEGLWLRAKAPDYSNYPGNIAQNQEFSMVYRAHSKPFGLSGRLQGVVGTVR
jgi:hypothetical protein